MNAPRHKLFGNAFLLIAAVALGSVGLIACGGGQSGGPKATASPTPGAQAQQAEQELAARRARLAEANTGISQIKSSANTLPMQDEELESVLSELVAAASKAQQSLTGENAEAALDKVAQLEKQAQARLQTLNQQEQEARDTLRQRYDRVVQNGKTLPSDLVWGFDGEIYLGYKKSAVEKAQQALKDDGYYDGPVNGNLDEPTRVAIARFQEVHGLAVTGIPTPYTRAKLEG